MAIKRQFRKTYSTFPVAGGPELRESYSFIVEKLPQVIPPSNLSQKNCCIGFFSSGITSNTDLQDVSGSTFITLDPSSVYSFWVDTLARNASGDTYKKSFTNLFSVDAYDNISLIRGNNLDFYADLGFDSLADLQLTPSTNKLYVTMNYNGSATDVSASLTYVKVPVQSNIYNTDTNCCLTMYAAGITSKTSLVTSASVSNVGFDTTSNCVYDYSVKLTATDDSGNRFTKTFHAEVLYDGSAAVVHQNTVDYYADAGFQPGADAYVEANNSPTSVNLVFDYASIVPCSVTAEVTYQRVTAVPPQLTTNDISCCMSLTASSITSATADKTLRDASGATGFASLLSNSTYSFEVEVAGKDSSDETYRKSFNAIVSTDGSSNPTIVRQNTFDMYQSLAFDPGADVRFDASSGLRLVADYTSATSANFVATVSTIRVG